MGEITPTIGKRYLVLRGGIDMHPRDAVLLEIAKVSVSYSLYKFDQWSEWYADVDFISEIGMRMSDICQACGLPNGLCVCEAIAKRVEELEKKENRYSWCPIWFGR